MLSKEWYIEAKIKTYGTVDSAHRQPSKIFTARHLGVHNWDLVGPRLRCARYVLVPRLHDWSIGCLLIITLGCNAGHYHMPWVGRDKASFYICTGIPLYCNGDNSDRNEALHHCTLLVNANIEILNKVLKSKDPRIETSATRSLRVDVKCLADIGISDPTHMDNVRDLKTAC